MHLSGGCMHGDWGGGVWWAIRLKNPSWKLLASILLKQRCCCYDIILHRPSQMIHTCKRSSLHPHRCISQVHKHVCVNTTSKRTPPKLLCGTHTISGDWSRNKVKWPISDHSVTAMISSCIVPVRWVIRVKEAPSCSTPLLPKCKLKMVPCACHDLNCSFGSEVDSRNCSLRF
jgi:hypothetical protein